MIARSGFERSGVVELSNSSATNSPSSVPEASVKNIYEFLRQKELDCARLESEIQALRVAIPLLAEEYSEPEVPEHEDELLLTQENTGTDGPTPSSGGD